MRRLPTWHLSLFLPFLSCWSLERVSEKMASVHRGPTLDRCCSGPSNPHLLCTGTSPRRRLNPAHTPSKPPPPLARLFEVHRPIRPVQVSVRAASGSASGSKWERSQAGPMLGQEGTGRDPSEDLERTRGFIESSAAVSMRDACPASPSFFSGRGSQSEARLASYSEYFQSKPEVAGRGRL